MELNPIWISILIAAVGLIGGIIARDRALVRLISDGDEKLHERINRVRDEYVKQSTHDGHMERIDAQVRELRNDIREQSKELKVDIREQAKATNDRLDAMLQQLGYGRTKPAVS